MGRFSPVRVLKLINFFSKFTWKIFLEILCNHIKVELYLAYKKAARWPKIGYLYQYVFKYTAVKSFRSPAFCVSLCVVASVGVNYNQKEK